MAGIYVARLAGFIKAPTFAGWLLVITVARATACLVSDGRLIVCVLRSSERNVAGI
jgi:hypothetical protein